jgi:RNA polymerase sigma-70 factor (ECF subfamily)
VDDLTRLALEARQGDRVALSGFVRRSQPEVWRLCAHLVDHGSADDLTQDVYVRALPALARFRGDSSARTWLLSIAHRTCADALRRRSRRRAILGRMSIRPSDLVVADPAGDLDLTLLLGMLDTDRRAAFVLTQVLGLGYREAAEVCDVPVGTIRSRVARARAELTQTVLASEVR